jgi:serine/threonine protein kinase
MGGVEVIGTVIDGSYRVDSVLGEGGFGVVYRCTELELERPVAVKMLHAGPVAERDLRRFATEGRSLASLNHPNVVHIYRLGQSDGSPYIAMEFVKGRTLRDLVEKDRPPARRILEIMRQVASGLGAIHAMGMLHRDLSPNNIMVLDDGTAKILDLGLAKTIGAQQSTQSLGALVGTMAYVSPEQLSQDQLDVQAEVFVFGVILYEALTGVHPFKAEHPMSLIYNIAQRPHEPIEDHLPDAPAPLSSLVSRCLGKTPGERPAGMGEVDRLLAELLGRADVQSASGPNSAATPGPRETPSNPYLNRTMLKHREDFFGRTAEIKRIFARFNATPPGSISIVGPRKIGKSSLLNYVYMRANRGQYLEHPDRMVMVFLDLQQDKGMSMETFVKTLLGIAELELRGRLDLSGCALNLDGVRDMVQRLDAGGFRLVLLLDEFETVTTNPNFSLEFFSFLRYLANHYNVAYLTSSERDLQVLCHTKEISDSPFFNIFTTVRLPVFRPDEAERLIREPSERVGTPLAPYTEQILDLSGLFPFFIQMACSHAVEHLDEVESGAPLDFGVVRKRFYEEARLHFRYIWEGLDEHERATVQKVAGGRSLPDSLRHVLPELENRCLVTGGAEQPRLFASTFAHFVKNDAGAGAKESKPGGGLFGKLFGGGKKS